MFFFSIEKCFAFIRSLNSTISDNNIGHLLLWEQFSLHCNPTLFRLSVLIFSGLILKTNCSTRYLQSYYCFQQLKRPHASITATSYIPLLDSIENQVRPGNGNEAWVAFPLNSQVKLRFTYTVFYLLFSSSIL